MDKKMAENALFNIFYKLLNVLFPLITSAYVSRILLSEGIGRVDYARNLATIFVFIAALGIPAYGTKVIASSSRFSNQEDVNKSFSELLIMLAISSSICFLIYVVLVAVVDKYSKEFLLYLATGLQILLVSINIDWLYQGKEAYKYITYRSFIVKICSIICILIFVRTKDDYIIYALITTLAIAGNNAFNIFHARKFAKFTTKGLNISRHLVPVVILLLSTIAGELYSKVDILMIGHFCSENNVGYYSNSIKVINTVLTAVTAITAVYLPRLSSLAADNKERFAELAREGLDIILFITIPCCTGLILVSDSFVCLIFGENFANASKALSILCPLIIIKGVGDLINYQVIISVGREKYFLITTTLAAIINILLNYYLIPLYQQNGAAIASVISELVVNVGMLFISSKIISLKFNYKYIITILVATLCMVFSVLIITHYIKQIAIQLVLCIVIGGGIYVAINLLLKNPLLIKMIKKCGRI